MVKCSVLLLAASTFIGSISIAAAPELRAGVKTMKVQADQSHLTNDSDTTVPIHRIVLLIEPVKGLADPLVVRLHNKSLAMKADRRRKRSLPRPKLPGEDNPTATFVKPGKLPSRQSGDPAETISAAQLTALADLYLTDSLLDRLTSRYRITVVDYKQVTAAIAELHIPTSKGIVAESAQKLCSHLESDAVVVVGAPALTTMQGATRDLIMRAEVQLAALRDPNGAFIPIHKPNPTPAITAHERAIPRVGFTVAGSASAGKAFLSAGYSSTYPALAEQAASQASAIALHTLSTGEQAPLMNNGANIAIAPVYGPDRADLLVLSIPGRRTEIGAVGPLTTNVSASFRPELLPIAGNIVIDMDKTAAAMSRAAISLDSLWESSYKPNITTARELGHLLSSQYLMVAHITDVEVVSAPSSENHGAKPQAEHDPIQPSSARPWERQAHAEACGALIRIQDGNVIWTDRGASTVTSREVVNPAARSKANSTVAMDAEKFALIDLKRRFAAFRSQFEQ